ncbi:MAG: zf-HC2 domain-containing protein [Deltaproteobacteria bacterium]|nr:zf-HC2 domain-containing protein [Deltaproteobacteria bacterium]
MSYACDDTRRAIPWLLDDELDPVVAIEVEGHLGSCAECRTEFTREGRLRQVVRRAVSEIETPAGLKARVSATLLRERRHRRFFTQMWPAAAAAAMLVALIWKGGSAAGFPELKEVTERHARDHDLPMDVVAADVGQVQRYFYGKLPFPVRVPELKGAPVRIQGGRVTHLKNREAAYLRYDAPRGRLAMFVYDEPGSEVSEVTELYQVGRHRVYVRRIHGYTVARWRNSGLVYSVVTDLPESEIPAILTGDGR